MRKRKPRKVYLLWFDGSNKTNAGWISYDTLDKAKADAYNEAIYISNGIEMIGKIDENCIYTPIKKKK